MSANNKTLIKEYEGKWYVFPNIQAETWCAWDSKKQEIIEGHDNELMLKTAVAICNSKEEALEKAFEFDKQCGEFGEGTEYGVQFERLYKDNSEVKIIP